MINVVENTQRVDISRQNQRVKPCTDHWVPNDSNGSTLYVALGDTTHRDDSIKIRDCNINKKKFKRRTLRESNPQYSHQRFNGLNATYQLNQRNHSDTT